MTEHPDMRTARQKIAGPLMVCPLGQHEDQPPGAIRVPAMQLGIRVVGKIGRLHPAHDRYSAKLLYQWIQRSGKGPGGCFLGNRAIATLAALGVLWHQIFALLARFSGGVVEVKTAVRGSRGSRSTASQAA